MGKNRPANTLENYSKKLKEGRCKGDGVNYRPWLSGHEFASSGIFIRIQGHTVPRGYVFLSHLEADLFRIYDHMPGVTDIKEQYALPLPETLDISNRLGIRHPYSGSYFNVMTVDLLVCKNNRWFARSVKTSKDLHKPRVIEKLQIEQAWCHENGLEWKLVTEKEINRDYVMNLRWLYEEGADAEDFVSDLDLLSSIERLLMELYASRKMTFPDLLDTIEGAYGLSPGAALAIFKRLVRNKAIDLDLTKPLNINQPWAPFERSERQHGRYASYS